MREILFRGKTAEGIWFEGDFCKPCNIVFERIGYDEVTKQDNVQIFEDFKVLPETVGQYTGLTDKNGKKIFEGDIVKHNKMIYEIAYFTENSRFAGRRTKVLMSLFPLGNSEVIGNIHDNPELLKGEVQ